MYHIMLFTGQRLDETGLYFYNARYYDPTIGRFISADSLILEPFNPQAFNRYSYCLNNPLKYIDPSGHKVRLGNITIYSDPASPVKYIKRHGGWQNQDTTTLIAAWDKFRELEPNMAKFLESSEKTYDFGFWAFKGSFTKGTWNGDQKVFLGSELKNASAELIAAVIYHESIHVLQGEQSFNPFNWMPCTIYEELVAYQLEYYFRINLGLAPGLSADVIDFNLGLTGDALNEMLEEAKEILGNALWSYNYLPLGNTSDVFPIPIGGGASIWGYTYWGAPIVGFTDPSVTNPGWWENVTGG
jgi:RHS repeat-associated protein